MKKIIITEKIKKEFLECFIYTFVDKRKVGVKDLENLNLSLEYIKFNSNYDINYKDEKILFTTNNFKNFMKFISNLNLDLKEIKSIFFSNKIKNLVDKYGRIFYKEKIVDSVYANLRKEWGYKIVKLTQTDVCLYCNRNFIINFNKKETTVELDHFYPKEKYPYLALNLYNLVPVCHTCNHKKRNSNKIHLHPFFDDLDKEIKFSLTLKNAKFYHSVKGFEIDVKGNSKKAKNHIKLFNLQALYNEHKDIILELIQKKYMYDESYLDELMKKYEGTLFKNREDLLRLVSGGYISEDEINKRPLSKFIKDISEELDLI
jgi:uncharacterized protein (TIGR02646 family)